MLALIVDDSRVARMKLRSALRENGYRTIEAENGLDAIEQMQQGELPDVALVDWNMPKMNGFDFVKHVRCDMRFDKMLLVMVTSETSNSKVAKALMAGANEYLMKPYSKALLFEKLEFLGLGT